MPVDWKPLREIINSHQRFVLSSHQRPDADALGSEMAVLALLESLGKTVTIANPSATPDHLAFLDPEGRAKKIGTTYPAEEIRKAEVHIVLDTSAWNQLVDVGKVFRDTPAVKVVIDHHQSADELGAVEFKDSTAEATGAMVVRMCEALGYDILPEMVLPLFCAIATDTGWLRFSSTTGDTLRIIGRLIDLGAKPHLIYEQLYEQCSFAKIRLASRVLSRMNLEADGRLAWITVTRSDFKETGAHPADTEDLVNETLKVAGTQAAFIAIEQINKTVKVSFRSRNNLNVAAVAESFGGGGHKQASGATVQAPMDEAVEQVRAAMIKALNQS